MSSELNHSLLISSVTGKEDTDLSELADSIEQVLKENNPSTVNEQHVQPDCVVIHVCDDNRNLEKNFECDRRLLLEKMTYFGQYLKPDPQQKELSMDVDISVHCDILVFEWLIQYIHCEQLQATPPLLDVQNVVSILISSHFLQMKALVAECIDFLCTHLKEVIPLPLDLSCLPDDIVCALADGLSVSDIDALNDASDKIASRLYRFHCERFIQPTKQEHKLFYCVYCKKLFTKEQHSKMECRKAPIFIDFNGRIRRKHCAQRGWYMNKYLLGLRLQRFSWTAIYWHLWALTRPPLFCSVCQEYVTLPNVYHCVSHKQAATCTKNALNSFYFACCQTTEQRFSATGNALKRGCAHKPHTIAAEYAEILDTVAAHAQFAVIPFECCESNSVEVPFMMDHFPQSATASSRTLKHHRTLLHHGHGHGSKRWTALSVKTGVWDPKYFMFGCQSPMKSKGKLTQNQYDDENDATDFDVYHQRPTFWFDDCDENDTTADNSFEYLSDLMAFDQIDFGECDEEEDGSSVLLDTECDDDDDEVFSDHDSVNSGYMHDFMCFHGQRTMTSSSQQQLPEQSKHTAAPGRVGKNFPILGRQIQPVNITTDEHKTETLEFGMNVNSTKRARSSSTFNMQQNDIQRLHKIMHSLHENRENTQT